MQRLIIVLAALMCLPAWAVDYQKAYDAVDKDKAAESAFW